MASARHGDLWQRLSDSSTAKTTQVWLAVFALALVCVTLATLYCLHFQHADIQGLLCSSIRWLTTACVLGPLPFSEVEHGLLIGWKMSIGRLATFLMMTFLVTSQRLGRSCPAMTVTIGYGPSPKSLPPPRDILLGLLLGLLLMVLLSPFLELRCRPGSRLARWLWYVQDLWQMQVLLLEHHVFTLLLWDALLAQYTTLAAELTVLLLLTAVPAASVMELLSIREAAWESPRRIVYLVLVAKLYLFMPALFGSFGPIATTLLLTASVRDALGHVRIPFPFVSRAGKSDGGHADIEDPQICSEMLLTTEMLLAIATDATPPGRGIDTNSNSGHSSYTAAGSSDHTAPAYTSAGGSTAPADTSSATGSSAHTAPADASTAAGSSDICESSSAATLSLEDTSMGNARQQRTTAKWGKKLLNMLGVIPEDEVASSTEECVVGANDASKVTARGGAAVIEGETHSSVILEEYSTGRDPRKEAPRGDFQTLSQLVSAHVERVKRADHPVQSGIEAEALSDAVHLLEESFAWEDIPFLGGSLEPLQKTQMCLRLRSRKAMCRTDILAAHAALELLLLDALGRGGKQKEKRPELKVLVRRLPKGKRVASVTLQEEDTDKSMRFAQMRTMQLLSLAMWQPSAGEGIDPARLRAAVERLDQEFVLQDTTHNRVQLRLRSGRNMDVGDVMAAQQALELLLFNALGRQVWLELVPVPKQDLETMPDPAEPQSAPASSSQPTQAGWQAVAAMTPYGNTPLLPR